MAVHTHVLLVDDPQPVFDWLDAEVKSALVRKVADQTPLGWVVRVALDELGAMARFKEHFALDAHDRQAAIRKQSLLGPERDRQRMPLTRDNVPDFLDAMKRRKGTP